MKITTDGHDVYSSTHKIVLKSDGSLKNHDPAGKIFSDDGKDMIRCLMGDCEYRTKTGTRGQIKTWFAGHLSAKH